MTARATAPHGDSALARARTRRRRWQTAVTAVVLVITLTGPLFVLSALSVRFGWSPRPDVLRHGTATITGPCQRLAFSLGTMRGCPATVEWEPESNWVRRGRLNPNSSLVVIARSDQSGTIPVESHLATDYSSASPFDVVLPQGQYRQGGRGWVWFVLASPVLTASAVIVLIKVMGVWSRRPLAAA